VSFPWSYGVEFTSCLQFSSCVKQQQINQYSAAVQKGIFGNLLQLDAPGIVRKSYLIPDDCYSRNASCALNLISTFLLQSLGRCLCWWTQHINYLLKDNLQSNPVHRLTKEVINESTLEIY
jgi:hypothetical protein